MIEIKFSGASVDEVVGDLVNFTGAILQTDLGLIKKEDASNWVTGQDIELPWETEEEPKQNVVKMQKEEPAGEPDPQPEPKQEPKPETKSEPKKEPAVETETAVSLQDTKKAMVAAVHAGKKDDVKAALKAHGIEKLSLATEEQLPSLYAAFKELT